MPELRENRWLIAIFAAFAAFAAYLPILRGGFVWDDRMVQGEQLPRLHSFADAFTAHPEIPEWSPNYYRPAVTLSYLLDARLNRIFTKIPQTPDAALEAQYAKIPHATNLFLHALTSFFVTLFAHRLLRGRNRAGLGALLAGLAFALHPIHTESVCFIAGRSDILATLFLVAAGLAAFTCLDSRKPTALAACGILCLAAFLSKEVALTGLLLLPACLWFSSRPPPRGKVLAVFGVAALAAALFFLLRFAGGTGVPQVVPGGAHGIGSFPAALAYYLRYLFWPNPMLTFVPDLPSPPETALVLALGLAGLAATLWAWRKQGEALPLLATGWIFAALAPPLFLLPLNAFQTPVAERYLYLPSVGLSLLLAWFATHRLFDVQTARRLLWAVAAALAVLCTVSDHSRARVWRDDFSLWSYAAQTPRSAKAALVWLNFGNALKDRGEYLKAVESYNRVLEPDAIGDNEVRTMAFNNLAVNAIMESETALAQRNPNRTQQRLVDAVQYLQKALELTPNFPFSRFNMGISLMRLAKLKKEATGRLDIIQLQEARRNLSYARAYDAFTAPILQTLAECDELIAQARAEEALRGASGK